jgi:hypothetical protein
MIFNQNFLLLLTLKNLFKTMLFKKKKIHLEENQVLWVLMFTGFHQCLKLMLSSRILPMQPILIKDLVLTALMIYFLKNIY